MSKEVQTGRLHLFTYVPVPGRKQGLLFLRQVRRVFPRPDIEVFASASDIVERLRRPQDDITITILFNPSHGDLEAMRSVRKFSGHNHFLLILPDQDKATLALAHGLWPSYISYIDKDPRELVAVIGKLQAQLRVRADSRSRKPRTDPYLH